MVLRRQVRFATLVTLAALGSLQPRAAAQNGQVVQTESGPVEGVLSAQGAEYLAIPYAAPPVGELRWRPPQPPAAWSEPRAASELPTSCPQVPSPFGSASVNEDCLYLNVYTPPRGPFAAFRRDPVMVWFHPGAFQYGSGGRFDPAPLVERGVVVVTVNYRLGPLGFLAHPGLSAESPDSASGNYGIMDQQAALHWVQDNIEAFGGDHGRVTIFGESAGGMSVHAHMVSPASEGLFDRAIVQSGAYSLTPPSLAAAEALGTTYAAAVGCPSQDAACLRAAPVSALLAGPAPAGLGYMPIVDGATLPLSYLEAFTTGAFNRVPLIEGTTHDEFRLFVALAFDLTGNQLVAEAYPAAIAATLGVSPAVVPAIVAQYPLANYASPALALSAVGTDAVFACNARAVRQLLGLQTPVWGYEFDDTSAPMATLPPVSFPYGAYHGAELEYLFDVQTPFPAPPLTAAQQALADDMVRYWTRFARFANPNTLQTPLWVRHVPLLLDQVQRLAPSETQLYTGFNADHKCDFWTQLAAASGG